MAKQKPENNTKLTRKQALRSRRERDQLRKLYWGLGLVIVLVLIVLGVGLYQEFVVKPNTPIATVNEEVITTQEYQDRFLYEWYNFDQSFGSQLDPSQRIQQRQFLASELVDRMIEEQLIRAEAEQRDISITEAEVTEQINQELARKVGGVTTEGASELATSQAESTATASVWTPTPTLTPSPTLTVARELTPTFTPAPTPTLYVLEGTTLNEEYTQWISTLESELGVSEAEYRQIIRSQILRQKLSELIGEDVPIIGEQAHARHILVETEEEAQQVLERLEQGEDFAALAAELSTGPSSDSGGDLGFVSPGAFVEPIDEVLFTHDIGLIMEPIQTDFGWHVVELLEREERELSPEDYASQQRQAFQNWLDEALIEAEVEKSWSEEVVP